MQYGANAGKVSRELVKRKIAAQLETLKNHPELPGQTSAIEALSQAIREFDVSPLPTHFYDINWLRAFEGRCADAYFQAWQGLPVKWEATAKKTIPPHWLTVGKRSSPLSHNHGARHAIEPAQAILNYAYSILESECKQALNAVGFDLSAGFLHSDVLHRNSLVYDLMELYRAAVDCLVLKLIASTTFAKGDIMTSATGECQFNPQLSRYIGSVCRLSQTEVDAGAAWLKGVLMSAA